MDVAMNVLAADSVYRKKIGDHAHHTNLQLKLWLEDPAEHLATDSSNACTKKNHRFQCGQGCSVSVDRKFGEYKHMQPSAQKSAQISSVIRDAQCLQTKKKLEITSTTPSNA